MEAKIWPDSAKINGQGCLEIGGCDVSSLVKEFGSPLYVVDEKTLRARCQNYRSAFNNIYPNTEVVFASKALCTIGISKIIASEGIGFDVSSGGELYTVIKAGADPKTIYFHGNNKSLTELAEGLKTGIGRFVVDNEQELSNLERVAEEQNKEAHIMIRVNPGIEAHTHDFIQTGKIDSKFGVPLEQLDSFIHSIQRRRKLKLMGLHAHIGSQILDINPFVEEAKLLLSLTMKYNLEEINIGGGLGISYLPDQYPPRLSDFAKEIVTVLDGKTNAKLVLEPGRALVGTAGITLYTAGVIKDIPGVRKYIIVDGGMADNPRPILYDARYTALLGNKADLPGTEEVTIAGRFCESGDILINNIKLPAISAGDIIAVASTGAYNYSMASNYNRVSRPAMILVNRGQASVIVKRESYEDLVINDSI